MAITYPTVDLNGKAYPVLASLQDATDYLAAEPGADSWRDGDEDDQKRWLIGASRALMRQAFEPGTLDGPDVPPALEQAAILLASAIASGFDPANPHSPQVKRQKAGTVEQDFYYAETIALRFPLPVMELLASFLTSTNTSIGPIVNGACAPSSFEDRYSTIYPGASNDDDGRWRRTYD